MAPPAIKGCIAILASKRQTTSGTKTEIVALLNAADVSRTRDNTAVGVNGSVVGFDWYLAHQRSYDNGVTTRDVDSWGGFLSYAVSNIDSVYAYYVTHDADRATYDGADMTRGMEATETILGYSHNFGGGTSFIAEYLEQTKVLPAPTLAANPAFWH